MKILVLIFVFGLFTSNFALATSICGKTSGFSYNKDTLKRPYKLSGFWLKQNTEDIRITYGNSPELISFVEDLKGSVFVCLDQYELIEKKYADKSRTYAKVKSFRVWLNGKEVTHDKKQEILFNSEQKRSILDLQTDPDLKAWERSTYLSELCYKSASAEDAYAEILNFKEQELLFDVDTETHIKSWVDGNEIIILALNGKMMDDGLTEDEATDEFVIKECNF